MRRHPLYGFDILKETNQLTTECKLIVLEHHEREDGLGYPYGLYGGDIHVYARICALVDVYDALTSDRPYRRKMPAFEALNLIQRLLPGGAQAHWIAAVQDELETTPHRGAGERDHRHAANGRALEREAHGVLVAPTPRPRFTTAAGCRR